MDQGKKTVIVYLLLTGIFSPVFADQWKASVVKNLEALVSSCIVLPCSFTHSKSYLPTTKLRGIWQVGDNKENRIYHEDPTRVLENYRGRTKMLGKLGDNNCTLEMNEIKDHDNGPFCFRIEIAENDKATDQMFSFVDNCVNLKMLSEPPKLTLTHLPTATEGSPYTIICSAIHTCPSHPPTLTWSRGNAEDMFGNHREFHSGNWEATSVLSFIAEEQDDDKTFTCTAEFYGRKTASASMTLNLKRKSSYNHIIIPTVVGVGTAVIFAVSCILILKKYKNRIAELQNQEGSVWNRLSRLSRRTRN